MTNSEVLIVGAGPVGLTMGLCLAQQGISFQIIDKKTGPTTTSNAVGVNCRTMEIWENLGFLEQALARGLKVHATSLYSEDQLLNRVEFDQIASKHNFMLALPQARTEALLLEQLAKIGSEVAWNSELVNLEQTADSVTAAVKHEGRVQPISAKWVIGCDGYHSSVRELGGIRRSCHDLPLHFLMVDAEVSGTVSTDSVNVLFHDLGMLFMIPMRDKVRVVVEISHDNKYKQLKTCEPDDFRHIVNQRCPGLNLGRIDWSSAFYIHECLAETYRNQRIFIAVDAAHTHSPMGGQGMNTGIQDTWNLAWKLSQVMLGEADEKLLDTYSLERRAIGQDVLKRSAKLTRMATATNFVLKRVRNFGIRHFADWESVRAKLANGISQANICYANSPLVKHNQVKKSGCLKYPHYYGRWTLFTTTEIAEPLPTYINIVPVETTLPLNSQLCLIRPDSYTACYANSVAEILAYLQQNYLKI